MTSNIGADLIKNQSTGSASASATRRSTYEKMRTCSSASWSDHFRPEFLNRVDEVVVFHKLTLQDYGARPI
jgi:ATP-dependent Clp protease ATP-binding subunit ClpC